MIHWDRVICCGIFHTWTDIIYSSWLNTMSIDLLGIFNFLMHNVLIKIHPSKLIKYIYSYLCDVSFYIFQFTFSKSIFHICQFSQFSVYEIHTSQLALNWDRQSQYVYKCTWVENKLHTIWNSYCLLTLFSILLYIFYLHLCWFICFIHFIIIIIIMFRFSSWKRNNELIKIQYVFNSINV